MCYGLKTTITISTFVKELNSGVEESRVMKNLSLFVCIPLEGEHIAKKY